jgi:hypothetical protein
VLSGSPSRIGSAPALPAPQICRRLSTFLDITEVSQQADHCADDRDQSGEFRQAQEAEPVCAAVVRPVRGRGGGNGEHLMSGDDADSIP